MAILLRICLVAFLITLAVGFVIEQPSQPRAAPVEVPAATALPVRSVAIEPEPVQAAPLTSSTRLPDMRTCAEIKGTEYRSPPSATGTSRTAARAPLPGFGLPAIPGPEVKGERWVLVDLAKQETTAMIGDRAALHRARDDRQGRLGDAAGQLRASSTASPTRR